MKVIKIDVVNKEIKQIDLKKGLEPIYKELECEIFQCFYPYGLKGRDCIYIDDEGALKDKPLGAFSIRGYPGVISGHGLVIGADKEGNSISAKTSLEHIKSIVRFEDTYYISEPKIHIITD